MTILNKNILMMTAATLMLVTSPAQAQEANGFLRGTLAVKTETGNTRAHIGTLYRSSGFAMAHADRESDITILNNSSSETDTMNVNLGSLQEAAGTAEARLQNSALYVEAGPNAKNTNVYIGTVREKTLSDNARTASFENVSAYADLKDSDVYMKNDGFYANLSIADVKAGPNTSFQNAKAEAHMDGGAIMINNKLYTDVAIATLDPYGQNQTNVEALANIDGSILVESTEGVSVLKAATITGKAENSSATANIGGDLIIEKNGIIEVGTIESTSDAKAYGEVAGGVRVTDGGQAHVGTINYIQ